MKSIASLRSFSLLLAFLSLPTLFFAQDPELFRPDIATRPLRKATRILPFFDKPVQIEAEVIDGYVIIEGDIIIGKEAGFFDQEAAVISGASYRWPNAAIPYKIAANHPKKTDILTAINRVNTETKLCMRERTTETDYVEFISADGCSSWIGKQGGRQEITIGSCSVGSIIHEIFHAAGMFHEQTRQDRDNFVKINWANITDGKAHNFEKYTERGYAGMDLGTYNYESIMHYGPTAFSKNGNATIESKIAGKTFGQRTTITTGDKNALRTIYPVSNCCNEDLLGFNPNNVVAKPFTGGQYRLEEGNQAMKLFPNKAEADRAVKIIKHYKLNKTGYVGRPNPSFEYWLVNNAAPSGALAGEDCIAFTPANLAVQKISGRWKITDGNSLLFDFDQKEGEARETLCLIKKYGFKRTCYVGRPDPSMTYLRK